MSIEMSIEMRIRLLMAALYGSSWLRSTARHGCALRRGPTGDLPADCLHRVEPRAELVHAPRLGRLDRAVIGTLIEEQKK